LQAPSSLVKKDNGKGASADEDGKKREKEDVIVQYIVIRKDLTKKPLRWSWGSVISNACHGKPCGLRELI